MIDYRSLQELVVTREGAAIGTLTRLPKGCEFRYIDGYAGEPAALHLPLAGVRVEGMLNLPTYFAGLVPEGVVGGAIRRVIRAAPDDLFALLAASGANAVGDLEVSVPGQEPREEPSLSEGALLIQQILSREEKFDLSRAFALPGMQPKLSIGDLSRTSRRSRHIAKFPNPEFPGILTNEHACMTLARRCGLEAAETSIRPEALIVRRFDRVPRTGGGFSKVHVEDLLQVMDRYPYAKHTHEYVELMEAMARIGVAKAGLLSALRLYVFSYLIGNGDLHEKNVSVLRDRGQWFPTPAYDLVSTLPYADRLDGADRMTLALADEQFGRFEIEDFVRLARPFGLLETPVVKMIRKLAGAALQHAPAVFDSAYRVAGEMHEAPEEHRKVILATLQERAKALTI